LVEADFSSKILEFPVLGEVGVLTGIQITADPIVRALLVQSQWTPTLRKFRVEIPIRKTIGEENYAHFSIGCVDLPRGSRNAKLKKSSDE